MATNRITKRGEVEKLKQHSQEFGTEALLLMLFYFFFHRLPCRPVVLHFYSTRVALSISLNPSLVKVPFDRGFVGNDYAILL